jgi:hypothetical protein
MEDKIHWIFILALPVSCIAWTVTKEEVFKEVRNFFSMKSENSKHMLLRKFYYMLTCEYCFSHYVTLLLLLITQYQILYPDWRGYLIAGFSIVWIANVYMSLYNIIRIYLKKEKIITKKEEDKIKPVKVITDQH